MSILSDFFHAAMSEAGNVGDYIERGLTVLKDPEVRAKVEAEIPEIIPILSTAIGAAPLVNDAEIALKILSFTSAHWSVISSLGATLSFRATPADQSFFDRLDAERGSQDG